ncbi:MAG: hypothetical protein LBC42_02100 [Puniceicoccales bacterium]|nr:hypothetical protein [Puniceicoccales bacterium]
MAKVINKFSESDATLIGLVASTVVWTIFLVVKLALLVLALEVFTVLMIVAAIIQFFGALLGLEEFMAVVQTPCLCLWSFIEILDKKIF